jgi:hypothetical protein
MIEGRAPDGGQLRKGGPVARGSRGLALQLLAVASCSPKHELGKAFLVKAREEKRAMEMAVSKIDLSWR